MKYHFLILILAALLSPSCEEPYEPEIEESARNILVVEGHLFDGETILNLSRTVDLDEGGMNPETGALVTVENMDGTYNKDFTEISPGSYTADLQLNPSQKYKVLIRTSAGNLYETEPVEVMDSPPLEEVKWEVQNGQVRILATSNGSPDGTRFYRYTFVETWLYEAAFPTSLQYVDGEVIFLPPEERYFRCYKTENSHNVVLATTEGLHENRISEALITEISPLESSRLTRRYSILVTQYAISREAYEFYDRLKSNTEDLGTLFDPQPSILTSNIQAVNHDKQAIGFITAGEVSQQRIFIHWLELPFEDYYDPPWFCVKDTVPLPMSPFDFRHFFEEEDYMPLARLSPASYVASSSLCVDCRKQGGEIKKPDFW